ncbi:unnamed protein product [Staurois parvus]|uniref:Uncharacterized protein n=1 Tax=Staurois parvus TaxID=386267 RepID=A0ABN9GMU2_9NEOB|nr:unnamed protein product [Staurois parvus]
MREGQRIVAIMPSKRGTKDLAATEPSGRRTKDEVAIESERTKDSDHKAQGEKDKG